MLVCVEGMRYLDAAQKLGISQEMIKHHLLRSRLTLIRKFNLDGAGGPAEIRRVGGHPQRKRL
jgi:DNA-directed RNA polymerase specialized sigma24 family protein